MSQMAPILQVFNDIRAGRERHWRSHSSLRHCPARHCERPRPLPWPRAGSALSPHRGWGKTRKVPVPRGFRRVLCCRRKRGLSFRRPSRASPRRRARFTVRTPAPVVLAARHLVLPGRSASARPLSLITQSCIYLDIKSDIYFDMKCGRARQLPDQPLTY